MLDNIIKQFNPSLVPVIFLAMLTLSLLASYLYVFKKPLALLNSGQITLQTLEEEQKNSSPLETDIAKLQERTALLEQELYGSDPNLPENQLVAHVIKQLDQIADKYDVKLNGVTPGNMRSILMFNEIPFHIDINGNYHDLYDWLQEVESRLGPMVVKEFDIQNNVADKQKRDMRLTIASYRQNDEVL